MDDNIRALALFSGGLDSSLAIKIIQSQGIDVIALNFVSNFFGMGLKTENMAKQLGVKLEFIDFKDRHLEMMKSPVYGFGKNMNPCIDCHSLMFRIAGELLPKYNAKFVISGEVLGQRPMSQNLQALAKVEKLSGMGDLIVRPLCGKLLPPTRPVLEGWIDSDCLLDISGRNRTRQMELIKEYGISEYPTPGGGCLLTDIAYSKRLRILANDKLLEKEYSYLYPLLKLTKFFVLGERKYLFVGRDDNANKVIEKYEDNGNLQIIPLEIPGPRIMAFGKLSIEEEELACEIFSRYSKIKGIDRVVFKIKEVQNENIIREEEKSVDKLNFENLEKKIKMYQVL
ncbi:MAG: tRNA (5-methylaminomethyl-2-thiouridylate)-methyltransferase [Fusobacteriaceae bacterium]|nr:tRNA (5-methylaminomethyl-2-thiouridylate)-methyltransferase [Fusobacteriaceae bacterium]